MRKSRSVTAAGQSADPADVLPYLLYLPQEYGLDPARRWPVVLFLHGAGERGDDLATVADHGLPRLAEAGREFPFILVVPQCPVHSSWPSELTVLAGLLDEVAAGYAVDPDRVCVTGLSMGGRGSWALATRYPQRFAAVAPICGGWLPEAVGRIRHVPVWAFHGALDRTVPVAQTEELVAALEAAGGEVRFTRYPDLDHDSWTVSYDNPELCSWLLAQRRVQG